MRFKRCIIYICISTPVHFIRLNWNFFFDVLFVTYTYQSYNMNTNVYYKIKLGRSAYDRHAATRELIRVQIILLFKIFLDFKASRCVYYECELHGQ